MVLWTKKRSVYKKYMKSIFKRKLVTVGIGFALALTCGAGLSLRKADTVSAATATWAVGSTQTTGQMVGAIIETNNKATSASTDVTTAWGSYNIMYGTVNETSADLKAMDASDSSARLKTVPATHGVREVKVIQNGVLQFENTKVNNVTYTDASVVYTFKFTQGATLVVNNEEGTASNSGLAYAVYKESGAEISTLKASTSIEKTVAKDALAGRYSVSAGETIYYTISNTTAWQRNLASGARPKFTVTERVDTLDSVSVSLGADITVNYHTYLYAEQVGAKMQFTMNGESVEAEGTATGNTKATASEYVYKFTGVSPQAMGDSISAQLSVGDEVIATHEGFTVEGYCRDLYAESAEALGYSESKHAAMKTLIADLLTYGAAAQEYVGYKTDDLINDGIVGSTFTALDRTDLNAAGESVGEESMTSITVFFDNVNKLRLTFTASDVSDLTVKVSDGEAEKTYSEADFVSVGGGKYTLTTEAIYATGFSKVFTFTVYVGETEGQTLTYSVNSYVYSKQASDNAALVKLVQATYLYGQSAENFKNAQ